jgi:hypothetical protein
MVAVLLELVIERPLAPDAGLTVMVRLALAQVLFGKVMGNVSPVLV